MGAAQEGVGAEGVTVAQAPPKPRRSWRGDEEVVEGRLGVLVCRHRR